MRKINMHLIAHFFLNMLNMSNFGLNNSAMNNVYTFWMSNISRLLRIQSLVAKYFCE